MKGLIDNWALLVVLFSVITIVITYVRRIKNSPSDEQIEKVKEWLLFAVIQAEKELGTGTGQLKLSYVYDRFLDRFPKLSTMIDFHTFSRLVDDTLNRMKHILETNKDIENYVEE